ncbi:MAG: BatD family protein [Acidobacteriota bacterium]
MRRRRLWALVLLAAMGGIVAAPAGAAGLSASAQVDRKRTGTEDTVVLTVRVEGDDASRIPAPKLPKLSDFRVVQGPSVSSHIQVVNGRMYSSRTFTYMLLPRREGTLEIPSLTLEAPGDVTLRTEPIRLEAVKGTVGGRGQASRDERALSPQERAARTVKVRVKARLDRHRAYVGQQVTLTYQIYTQAELTGLELADAPSYPGFWVEELKVEPNPVGQRAILEGQEYVQYTVMRKALFPTRAGNLEIPALSFSLGVRGWGSDPFESLFFGTGRTIYRKSEAMTLEVLPLPEDGRPASFTGAVGRFRLMVSPDRQELRVNEAISLRVRVSGEGNLRPAGPPTLPELPDFKTYDPKVEEQNTTDSKHLKGSKVWDYVLLPLAAGAQEIPPVEFSYFDPVSARYHTLRSKPIRMRVERGEAPEGSALAAVRPREVKLLRTDIRHLRLAPARLIDRSRRLSGQAGFVVALALPAVANLFLGLAVWRRQSRVAEPGALRRRRAARLARRALQRAAAAQEDSAPRFFDEVSNALRVYVADKLNRSAAGLTLGEIEQALQSAGVRASDLSLLRSCLEACDRGRFAPSAARSAARSELADHARRAIDSLEAQL